MSLAACVLLCTIKLLLGRAGIQGNPVLPHVGTGLGNDSKSLGEGNLSESAFWNGTLLHRHDSKSICLGNSHGVFPDVNNCSTYFRCINGKAEQHKCHDNFSFDVNASACVRKAKSSCVQRTDVLTNVCSVHQDGTYPDFESACRRFYSCLNGDISVRGDCPEGSVFDLVTQSCRTDARCVRLRCTDEGTFAIPGTDCRGYYTCRSGVPVTNFCPRGQILDHATEKCIGGDFCYDPICTGRLNGDYADTTQECRVYFTCTGGHLTELQGCPRGTKHDGHQCVVGSLVSCEKPEKTAVAVVVQKDNCWDLPNGTHIVPGTDCHEALTCEAGVTVRTVRCVQGQRFNGRECASTSLTQCLDLCSLKPNGFYASDGCKEYYECAEGLVRSQQFCESGSLFNGEICVPKAFVACPNVSEKCVGLRDGVHPDYWNGCRSYFYCSGHELVFERSCGRGQAWNGQACVNGIEVTCRGPEPFGGCRGLLPGLYQDLPSGCAHYLYCRDGKRTLLSCPRGHVYDGESCVHVDEYTCPVTHTGLCAGREDGYTWDTRNGCRSYVYCSKQQSITYLCPGDLVFDGSNCVPPLQFQCPFQSQDCTGKNNGYHPDLNTGCRKYYFCHSGDKITTIQCNGKKVFNGERCVVSKDPQRTCANAGPNPCRSLTTGIYVVPNTTCERFYRCENGLFSGEETCVNGTRFDGVECVRGFECSNPVECRTEGFGFHQDLTSRCRNYYFCIGKRKSFVTCPDDMIFDGKVCVSTSSYTCPHL